MAISKLAILSALLAGVSSSPLLPQGAHGSDEKVLPGGQAGPVITGIPSPDSAPAPAGAPRPPPPARPTRLEPGQASSILRVPQPAQTTPALTPVLVPRLDIGPMPAASSGMPAPIIGFVPAPGCTSTLSEGRLATPCYWDYTKTIYPSTVTRFKSVDCHGCSELSVVKEWYYCPNMRIDDTKEVATPSTIWSTVCEPSIALREAKPTPAAAEEEPLITPQPYIKRGRGRTPQADIVCPTTYVVQPEKSAGKTLTRFSKFTTTTVYLNCKGCPLVISTALAGYGPANGFTKTTTLPVGTTTTYACY